MCAKERGDVVRVRVSVRVRVTGSPEPLTLTLNPGPGPSFGGEHRQFEWGRRAVGLCPRVCGGDGGCAGGGVPLEAVPALS